jgi:hypothetical protein
MVPFDVPNRQRQSAIPLREFVTQTVKDKLADAGRNGARPWVRHMGKLKHPRRETARINREHRRGDMALVLDTSALSAAAEREPSALAVVAAAEHLAVPVIVLGEYRLGMAQYYWHDASAPE